jgi:hypothetical protein
VISCLVFSRNRPMQLDALLRSIETHAQALYGETTVLYRSDSPMHALAYLDCLKAHPRVESQRQSSSFELDLREWFDRSSGDWIGFHCDDDLFYRSPLVEPLPAADELCYALRLGKNTTFCHPLGVEQQVPTALEVCGAPWFWPAADHDFGYPFSLDGHIYRRSSIGALLAELRFDSPNDFEHRGQLLMREPGWPKLIHAPYRSCVVSVPANRVNDGYANPCSDNPDWQPANLTVRFLAGERIWPERMDFSDVHGAHQEIPLVIGFLDH